MEYIFIDFANYPLFLNLGLITDYCILFNRLQVSFLGQCGAFCGRALAPFRGHQSIVSGVSITAGRDTRLT